jgi:DNA helicase II / ATP-dependent DNA helicase PcrA
MGYDGGVGNLFDLASPSAQLGEELNRQQRTAVHHGGGPLLVVAGAGTGKTRVITERIRHLLETDPKLPGESILALTFTDRAAGEMKHRVIRTAGERGQGVFVGTFHAFCNALLLERNPKLQTLDDVDHWILLRRNLAVVALERYRRLAEPGQFLGDFVKFFSRCQDELVTPDDYDRYVESLACKYAREKQTLLEDEQRLREGGIAEQREIARAYRASDRLLRERNLLTFGMQLLEAVHLLRTDSDFAVGLRGRYRYILVDEFQDTNIAQIELLWQLAADHRNVVAVGDNAQAIYRFRGASFGSFTIFLERFAGVPRNDIAGAARFVQPLVDNYRSTARILRTAGQVVSFIDHSPLVPKKELVPHKPDGEKVRIMEFGSTQEEARWIAAEIDRLRATGLNWRKFAALYRIHAHRAELVRALEERGIPFVIRNLSILDHPLVRDLLAYLRLIVNSADNIACARVLAASAWGIEPADLVRTCERAAKARRSLWDELQAPQGELSFSGRPPATNELITGLSELRRRSAAIDSTDLFEALEKWLELPLSIRSADRAYIRRLAQFVREWQSKGETSRLAEFVEYLDYFMQAGGQINLEQDSRDAVQLMTVHAAKGLEFEHVFVLRLTHRGFPMAPRAPVLEFPEALMKEELPRGDFHIQEERRLFYVAITRARERLTLTTVVHKRSRPSVFLEDILSAPHIAKQNVEQAAPVAPAAKAARMPAVTDQLLFTDAKPRIYSQIARWAERYRPPVFEPLQLSASGIEAYQKCPQKYLFSKVWGIGSGPAAATTFGNVMHNTIRQFIAALRKGLRLSFEEVVTIFRREWTSAGFEDRHQEELYLNDGIEQLRAFHTSALNTPAHVTAQEKRFTIKCDNGIELVGRMDQVNRVAPGEVEIIDYKTGKPKSETHAQKDLQLSVYALAAREVLDVKPVRLIYYNLEDNSCVVGSREEKQLQELHGTIQEVAFDIRAREFPARPGYICKYCEFRFLCPAQESRSVQIENDKPAEQEAVRSSLKQNERMNW